MKLENFLRYTFAICGALFIVLLVGFLVTDEMLESATGKTYTEEKWFVAEQYVCAKQGLEAQQYIGQSCSLFGCVEVERTKCVGVNIEKKLDYDDPIFCQYTMKGDLDWC